MYDLEELRETITAMTARLRFISNNSKSIAGRADAEKRDLTPAEARMLDKYQTEFDQLENELKVAKAELAEAEAQERDAGLQQPQARITQPMPIQASALSPQGRAASGPLSVGNARLFNAMFPDAPRVAQRGEFSDLGELARAVYVRDPRLFNAASGQSEGVAADGGFFVSPAMFAGLMDNSLQQEAVRPNATIIPMASGQVSIPMFDLSNRSTGIATLEGKTTSEGATAATQKAKVRSIELAAKKVVVLVPTTTELLQDAPQLFSGLLQTAMTDALAQTLDSWFISGTGAGAPVGIMNAPCLVSVAKDTSQVAATLTPTNISGMVSRLAPGSWAKAVWICSPSALAQLFVMQQVVKNVAASENVGGFQPGFFAVLPDGKFSLCGRPLIVSDRCAALGTKGDIMLCDLSQYLVGIRQDAVLMVDNSLGFKEGEVWFKLVCRIDGQPAQAAPITPRVGSATLSPFVSLDTRA